MSSQSSRIPKLIVAGAAAGALAIGAVAATGCGSDDENTDSVNNAIDSVQKQASSVQSSIQNQVSTALDNAQEQAKSVEDQAKSIQENIGTQTNGGSGVPGY